MFPGSFFFSGTPKEGFPIFGSGTSVVIKKKALFITGAGPVIIEVELSLVLNFHLF